MGLTRRQQQLEAKSIKLHSLVMKLEQLP
ncbi:hypothetical protein A2U01_0090259, partial [Trifolium medium]|nr:hypothetical protein [Trifolium medium]